MKLLFGQSGDSSSGRTQTQAFQREVVLGNHAQGMWGNQNSEWRGYAGNAGDTPPSPLAHAVRCDGRFDLTSVALHVACCRGDMLLAKNGTRDTPHPIPDIPRRAGVYRRG